MVEPTKGTDRNPEPTTENPALQPDAHPPLSSISKLPTPESAGLGRLSRPIEALSILGAGIDTTGPRYADLQRSLANMDEFRRISEGELVQYAGQFKDTVNFTGYSGQGVHPGQRQLLDHGFAAIMNDLGYAPDTTLLMSGGTALGIPDAAIQSLVQKRGYRAVGMMALPGMAYPRSGGYEAICADDAWKNWGDETQAMAKVATATILAGGGAQALTDALLAVRDRESVAVIVNCFNGLARIPYRHEDARGDIILQAGELPKQDDGIIRLGDLQSALSRGLIKDGLSEDDAKSARVAGLPVSGLVTEIRKGERRACAQDLLYFAITGNQELLPKEFRKSDPAQAEAYRTEVTDRLKLYYLLDDPSEGIFGSTIIRLDTVIAERNTDILEKVIEHAAQHDVHNPKTGHFGPPALGAKNEEELAAILKSHLRIRLPIAA